jgi:transcription initiation factor TFIID subunit TAF12
VDDFVDDILHNSIRLARHRNAPKLESRDVRYVLERQFKMNLPPDPQAHAGILAGTSGTASSTVGARRPAVTAHQQRMALIEKALKKP